MFAAAASTALASNTGAEQLSLKLNQSINFTPGFLPAQVVCDDLTVIKVEDAGQTFKITGLKAGSTLCGFTSTAMRGRRRVIEFVVTP